jgi:hypothetical protein
LGPGVGGYSLTLQGARIAGLGAWSAGLGPGPAATRARTRWRELGTGDRAPGSAAGGQLHQVGQLAGLVPGRPGRRFPGQRIAAGGQLHQGHQGAHLGLWAGSQTPATRSNKHKQGRPARGPLTWEPGHQVKQLQPVGPVPGRPGRPGRPEHQGTRPAHHGPGGLVPAPRSRASRVKDPAPGSPGGVG